MAPRLSIPVSANLDEFKSKMDEAASHTGTAVRKVVTEFAKMNEKIVAGAESAAAAVGAAWVKSAALTLLKWTAIGTTILVTIKAIGGLVSQAKEQIAEMVAIADKAAARGVSPEFFQAFTAAGRDAVDQVKILEDALLNAFKNTRQRLDPAVSPVLPDVAKQNEFNEAATRTQQIMQTTGALLISQGQTLEERQLATLKAMQEMMATGRTLSALNIGEKLFGRELMNNIEIGKTSITDLINTIEGKLNRTLGKEIFDNETVKQAKELDDRLNKAWFTISQNLAPSFNQLGQIAAQIKSVWVEIVELMARASNLLPRIQASSQGQREAAGVVPTDEAAAAAAARQAAADRLRLGAIRGGGAVSPEFAGPPAFTPPAPPTPRKPFTIDDVRGAIGPTPEEKKEAAEAKTAFDAQVDSINKHIAALEADAAAVGKTAAQHAVLRAELALLQAVEREGGEITNEQITKYAQLRATLGPLQAMQQAGIKLSDDQAKSFEQVTKRLGEAAQGAETAKEKFKALHEAIQFGGQQLVDIFDALSSKTKDFGKTMESVLNSFKRALLEALLTGQGALAGLLGTKSNVPGATGGILGEVVGLFSGGGGATGGFGLQMRAAGGPVNKDQPYIVGESGKEIFVPSSSGVIVPNAQVTPAGVRSAGSSGNGAFNVVIENHGADVEQKGATRNNSGGFDFRVAVRSIMKEAHAGGEMDDVMGRYGSAPRGVGR
jgi:hypothetical protein